MSRIIYTRHDDDFFCSRENNKEVGDIRIWWEKTHVIAGIERRLLMKDKVFWVECPNSTQERKKT